MAVEGSAVVASAAEAAIGMLLKRLADVDVVLIASEKVFERMCGPSAIAARLQCEILDIVDIPPQVEVRVVFGIMNAASWMHSSCTRTMYLILWLMKIV